MLTRSQVGLRTLASQSQFPNPLLLLLHRINDNPSTTLLSLLMPLASYSTITLTYLEPHSTQNFTFSNIFQTSYPKPTPRINILKALAGTPCGQHKEKIVIAYKSLFRSLFLYAVPIWFLPISETNINKPQTLQSSVLFTATGSV